MKLFLKNISLFVCLVLILITAIISFTYSNDINFVSNSVSNNAKARFIANQLDKAEEADIALIGSSMSLNNINASKIEASLGVKCFNFASWGMKIDNYMSYSILKNKKYIVMNIFFTDIGNPYVIPQNGYPYTNNLLLEYSNVLINFNTYLNQTREIKKYIGPKAYKDYSCLNFDPWGGVLLDSANFNIIPSRWNNDEFKSLEITKAKMDDFIKRLVKFREAYPDPVLLVLFSPPQQRFKNNDRFNLIEDMSRKIMKKCKKTYFYNQFNTQYDDKLYLDNCHLNHIGANAYTDTVSKKLSELILQNQQ